MARSSADYSHQGSSASETGSTEAGITILNFKSLTGLDFGQDVHWRLLLAYFRVLPNDSDERADGCRQRKR